MLRRWRKLSVRTEKAGAFWPALFTTREPPVTPEGLVKKKVKRLLDEFEVWHCSPVGGALGRAGIPDVLACVRGHFLAIECKASGNQPTKIQEYELNRIAKSGGCAVVVNEDGILYLHDWLARMTGKTEKLGNGTSN